MSRGLLALVLTLSFALGACAPDPLLSAPPPSRLIATVKLGIGAAESRVDATRGDIYFLSQSGRSINVMNGLSVTHIITDVGTIPGRMHTALLPAQRLALTLGTSRDTVAIIRDFTVIRQEPVDMEFIDYIFADDKQGMVYVLGKKGNAKSAASDLGFIVRFAGDKRLPAIGLGRFFPHDALVDSTHGLFYVRGTVPESAERAIAGFYSLQGEIQVWRGQERMSTLSINSAYDLWVIDPATGAVFFVIDDQVLHKTVLRRYDGTAVQDVDYPLVNGASRSCATSGGGRWASVQRTVAYTLLMVVNAPFWSSKIWRLKASSHLTPVTFTP